MMTRRTALAGAGALLASCGSAASRARVPAEHAPHELTFMQWPASRRVYREGGQLAELQGLIAQIANSIADFEPVVMLADAGWHARARKLLSERVALWDIPTEDLWARDSGPITAIGDGGARQIMHIRFNGWGARQIHREDSRIAARVAERLGLPLIETGLTGEGGGVEQDGAGVLIAHESSWLGRTRNPGLSRDEITTRLLAAFGADRMIWAPGLAGRDITDYHIDSLARFTAPGRVLMNLSERPASGDPFDRAARQTEALLRGAGLAVEAIPDPERLRDQDPDFLASYVNFYALNGAVIAAQFGDTETDALARDALSRHYPGREIIMLNADPLGRLGGGIHCATRELPRAA